MKNPQLLFLKQKFRFKKVHKFIQIWSKIMDSGQANKPETLSLSEELMTKN